MTLAQGECWQSHLHASPSLRLSCSSVIQIHLLSSPHSTPLLTNLLCIHSTDNLLLSCPPECLCHTRASLVTQTPNYFHPRVSCAPTSNRSNWEVIPTLLSKGFDADSEKFIFYEKRPTVPPSLYNYLSDHVRNK